MASSQFKDFKIPPDMKKAVSNIKNIVITIALVLIAWSGFFQIQPEEIGVITRFGKYTRSSEPGLNFKIPFSRGL